MTNEDQEADSPDDGLNASRGFVWASIISLCLIGISIFLLYILNYIN